LTFKG